MSKEKAKKHIKVNEVHIAPKEPIIQKRIVFKQTFNVEKNPEKYAKDMRYTFISFLK